MIDQSYSEKALKRYQRRIRTKGMTVSERDTLLDSLDLITNEINNSKYEFSNFSHRILNKKQIWRNNNYQEQLVLRYTNHILKRILKVKQSNRNEITENVANLLSSGQSFFVIKTDIKNFYESIPFSFIIDKVSSESIFSNQVQYIINEIKGKVEIYSIGLPRGICISPTISELYMREFDSKVNLNESVFYYARYVDDVIIFCTYENKLTVEKVKSFLPKGLKLNSRKTLIFNISCRCKIRCTCSGSCKCIRRCSCRSDENKQHSFEYLGYKYIFSDLPKKGNKKEKKVTIRIGHSKVNKIKTRIIQSFLAHFRHSNFNLLKNRIQFLTSNYYVYGNIDSSNLKAGIYYSYPNLTEIDDLEELDIFLRKSIFCKKGSFGLKIGSSLSRRQKLKLTLFSFTKGYKNRIMVNFTGEEINKIKYCWNNG